MKSLIIYLLLLVCPQLASAAVDGWRMNPYTGKPDYFQTGIDSATVTAIAASTTSLAVQTAALDSSKISEPSSEGSNGQFLMTDGAGGRTWASAPGSPFDTFNIWQSTNIFNSILMSTGTHGSGDDLLAAGAGARFFFYPKKSAVRGGAVTADQWDDANIGNWSIALGYNPIASAQYTIAIGAENTATYSGAVSVGGGGNNVTGQNSAAYGGSDNDVGGGNSGALAGNQVNVTGSQAGALAGGPSTVSGDFSASIGGTNTTVSGKASVAGGEWTQAASDYSFVYGRYVGLSDAADGSMLFGYDTSSVKTYTESGKFYIHGLDLRVSSSTTAAVKYGLTKEGVATVHSITATDSVVASTFTATSTATLAAISVTGAAAFTSATSTVAFSGWIDVGMVQVSSTCALGTADCTATCPSGKIATSCTFATASGTASIPYRLWYTDNHTACQFVPATSTASMIVYADCMRIKY